MPTPPVDPAVRQRVIDDLLSGKYTRDQISVRNGASHGTVSKIKSQVLGDGYASRNTTSSSEVSGDTAQNVPPVPGTTQTESEEITANSWKISLPNTRICTLEQLVEHSKIDLRIWEIERFLCNKYEVAISPRVTGSTDAGWHRESTLPIVEPLFQVKAFLKKKVGVANAINEIEELKKEAQKYSPKFTGFKPRASSGSGNVVEFSIYDHHFGSLIWGKETGGADWDNTIALNTWKNALASLVHKVKGFSPEKALLVLGNDQQNADNRAGLTENLTPQVMDSRYQKVYGISKEASRWAIDKLLAEYGAVDVVMVPGNHDPLATWHLGDYLQTWYRNCPNVFIDNGVPMRKWWEHGICMILFEHGHKGKLPDYDRVMASEKPEMWGRTKWREAHTGDKHHRQVIEHKGATIRGLPSLRPSCAWSTENHHTGSIRAAEAFVWSKTEGLVGQATYSIFNGN